MYFEWDRANLTPAAYETLEAGLARARQCNISAVTVTGHADTSGAADYNQRLSERRAAVVRDALVANGAPIGAIAIEARGESQMALPTRDGVREPLNRRASVIIRFD